MFKTGWIYHTRWIYHHLLWLHWWKIAIKIDHFLRAKADNASLVQTPETNTVGVAANNISILLYMHQSICYIHTGVCIVLYCPRVHSAYNHGWHKINFPTIIMNPHRLQLTILLIMNACLSLHSMPETLYKQTCKAMLSTS